MHRFYFSCVTLIFYYLDYCLCFTTFAYYLLVSFWVSHISGDACSVSIYYIYPPLYVFSLLFLSSFSPFFLYRIRQLLDLNTFTFRLDLHLRPPNVTYILRTISSKNPKQSILIGYEPSLITLAPKIYSPHCWNEASIHGTVALVWRP
jgi:hypothetical protein